jgi:hypothetical protein
MLISIFRYNACWLPLLAKHLESPISEGPLVVPLDCEWIWHCHRLNPVGYQLRYCCLDFLHLVGNHCLLALLSSYGTNLTVKNFMERSSITLMLYLLSMEFVKGKLKKFGIDSIHMSVMTSIWLSQKLSMKKFQPLRNVRTMIWCRQLKGRALSFIR